MTRLSACDWNVAVVVFRIMAVKIEAVYLFLADCLLDFPLSPFIVFTPYCSEDREDTFHRTDRGQRSHVKRLLCPAHEISYKPNDIW